MPHKNKYKSEARSGAGCAAHLRLRLLFCCPTLPPSLSFPSLSGNRKKHKIHIQYFISGVLVLQSPPGPSILLVSCLKDSLPFDMCEHKETSAVQIKWPKYITGALGTGGPIARCNVSSKASKLDKEDETMNGG